MREYPWEEEQPNKGKRRNSDMNSHQHLVGLFFMMSLALSGRLAVRRIGYDMRRLALEMDNLPKSLINTSDARDLTYIWPLD